MPNTDWGKFRLRNLALATEELAKALHKYADNCNDVECEMVNILMTPVVRAMVSIMAPVVGLKVSGNTNAQTD